MNKREAISLLRHDFRRVTVTTHESGERDVFHYFTRPLGHLQLNVEPDDSGRWLMTVGHSNSIEIELLEDAHALIMVLENNLK